MTNSWTREQQVVHFRHLSTSKKTSPMLPAMHATAVSQLKLGTFGVYLPISTANSPITPATHATAVSQLKLGNGKALSSHSGSLRVSVYIQFLTASFN
jgi:hypothetical protein